MSRNEKTIDVDLKIFLLSDIIFYPKVFAVLTSDTHILLPVPIDDEMDEYLRKSIKVEVHYKNVKYLWSKRAFFEPRPFFDEFGRRISNHGMVLIFDKKN